MARYIDGFVVPVPLDKKDEYRAAAAKCWPLFKEYGATRHIECWADDIPDGTSTDFKRAVKVEPNETVVFSWIVYKSKAHRDSVNKKIMADPRMAAMCDPKNPPVDFKRMLYGGFKVAVSG